VYNDATESWDVNVSFNTNFSVPATVVVLFVHVQMVPSSSVTRPRGTARDCSAAYGAGDTVSDRVASCRLRNMNERI
jgi:hypothetical protein